MKLSRFNRLTTREKASLLYASGRYLMSVSEGRHAITLFAIDSTFVEVYFDSDTRQIDRITIASKSNLDKYLKKIKLA